jgi:hypothetical protein
LKSVHFQIKKTVLTKQIEKVDNRQSRRRAVDKNETLGIRNELLEFRMQDFKIISTIEISTSEGHFLIIRKS